MMMNDQDEAVEEKVTAFLPSSVLSGLADANWKARLSAMENMTDVCLIRYKCKKCCLSRQLMS